MAENGNPRMGELLRTARGDRDREKIAQRLRIADRYLDALERDALEELPSVVYFKHYVRAYAQAVGLPWERIADAAHSTARLLEERHAAMHGIDTPSLPGASTPDLGSWSPGKVAAQHPLLIPRTLRIGLAGIVMFLVGTYFVWEVAQFLSPPKLEIREPSADIIVTTPHVHIAGVTTPEARVTLNGQPVGVDQSGVFSADVPLQKGLNTIRVSAASKHRRERLAVRYVLYKEQDAEPINSP